MEAPQREFVIDAVEDDNRGDWTKKLRTKRKPGPEDRIHT